MRRYPILLLTIAIGFACSGGDDPVEPQDVSFANDIQPIFNGSCASLGCHIGPNPQRGMDLSLGEAYDDIVGVTSVELNTMPRVTPGEPSNSYLYRKVQDTHLAAGGTGDRMPPPPRQALDAEDVELIRVWIQEGALSN